MLARAFYNDPLFGHFFPAPAERLRQLEAFFLFRLRTELDDAYVTSPALEALAIWQAPREHGLPLRAAALPPGLAMAWQVGWQPLLRMIQFQRWSAALRLTLVHEPYWYLDTLAVAPTFQRQGYARQLIAPALRMADDAGVPVYLETQNRRNIDIYAHFGFAVIHRAGVPGSAVEHYCMFKR